MAALGLHCYEWFSSCEEWGSSLVAVRRLLTAAGSLVVEHGLQSTGSAVVVPCLVVPQHVGLPRWRTELVFPALQDEFFITGPPRKPYFLFLIALPTTAVTQGSIYSGYFKKCVYIYIYIYLYIDWLLGHCCLPHYQRQLFSRDHPAIMWPVVRTTTKEMRGWLGRTPRRGSRKR